MDSERLQALNYDTAKGESILRSARNNVNGIGPIALLQSKFRTIWEAGHRTVVWEK